MSKIFSTINWEKKERDRFNRRMDHFEQKLNLIALANEISNCWMGKKRDYVYISNREWRRNADVDFNAMDGEIKLKLTLAKSDSLKMLEPILWMFLDDFDYTYMGKKAVIYYHKNGFNIEAVFEHSAYCKVVKTGKMIPETKIECG